ncbi:hypothetical protein JCM3775_004591 [Rhodotorula graminis]|uniref:Mediator of RNA polymerase II transcription subunit 9 n=1 Tax=Rhodotorula graminis (strain WP1) TaxID=578459 RepID=A0A194S8R5_RHOGW|nr:uncharacterized protein RHOBADRAFT_51939 [Rhodotorula graminis WP1]KPV76964.1 hypothetical protein RHOBADRAFT_51939 [Rhodotorula graminis WP1]
MAAAPQAPAPAPAPLDTAQFATLFPSVVRLAHLASSSSSPSTISATDPADSSHPAEPDAHHPDPKLELSRQAAALHSTLRTLDAQVAQVPNAHLSVDDQHWLVEQLQLECSRRRAQLAHVASLTQLDLAPAHSPAHADADMADAA